MAFIEFVLSLKRKGVEWQEEEMRCWKARIDEFFLSSFNEIVL